MVEQLGMNDVISVDVTRASNPVNNWILAIIILAVIVAIIFIYCKIKK